jgi:hypothetical protein
VCFGPGLWPGPCRQARWGGRGSGVNGAPQARPACGMRSTVEAGGADPDNARRSAPAAVTSRLRRSLREANGLMLTNGRGTGVIRRAPHAAGHRGRRARQLGTPGGLPPKGRDESCRTANGELPGPDPCRLRRATLAAHLPHDSPRPPHVLQVQAVRPGAPWRALEAVEKLVTGPVGYWCAVPLDALHMSFV